MREAVDHAVVLENWSAEVAPLVARPPHSDAFTFGFMGRLSPVKGADVLAVAIDQLQQQDPGRFRLHVAGDFRFVNDRHRGAVEGAFGRLGQELERVGWVDPMAFLGSIDALVVPSVWAEPFGLVAIEAMAAAVPLVVTDAGALPEIVGSGYPWIARKGDPASLADVMTRLADASEIRRDYVARSRRRWERRFSPSAGEARFLALLAECAAK
jgi:glycosyltransferase involved in cell wall biosynthesis